MKRCYRFGVREQLKRKRLRIKGLSPKTGYCYRLLPHFPVKRHVKTALRV